MHSGSTARLVRIDPARPDPVRLDEAAGVLAQRGVVVIPTSGLYGLAADALDEDAVRRVFAVKGRPADKPLLVLIDGLADLDRLVRRIPEYARPLLGLWPGGITLIFEAASDVPAALTGGTGTIGVRQPAHPVARALIERFGGPVTGTSANLSGDPAPAAVEELAPAVLERVDLVLDAGRLAGGPGSTILDATGWPVRLIREGALTWPVIERVLEGARRK